VADFDGSVHKRADGVFELFHHEQTERRGQQKAAADRPIREAQALESLKQSPGVAPQKGVNT